MDFVVVHSSFHHPNVMMLVNVIWYHGRIGSVVDVREQIRQEKVNETELTGRIAGCVLNARLFADSCLYNVLHKRV